MQAVPLGYHHQGGAGEAHWKAPHRQYEMVVKQEICVNLSNQFTKSASIWTLKISRRRVMFRTHKLSFWYQFLVGGNAHIIQGFESEHSYFPTFIVVFSLTACTSHVYPIYYILSMIQCTSILTPCFQSVIQSPRTVLVLPRVLSFVSLSCLAEKIKLLFRNMPSYSCYLHG